MTVTQLKKTPLFDLWSEREGRFTEFAGYEMPVQFSGGVKEEHLWTRQSAGLFDVSHMGPCYFELTSGLGGGDDSHGAISEILERLVPGDIRGLRPGQARLTVLLNAQGGILDDLIVTRPSQPEEAGRLYIVVNGAMKEQDFALLSGLGSETRLVALSDHVLIALQGPLAAGVLEEHIQGVNDLRFMQSSDYIWNGAKLIISRCGYTGEDGFEMLVPGNTGVEFTKNLLADERVKAIGLGARDSLRLEAGLCLYGHDISVNTTPVEADLSWLIGKRRRSNADFPGAELILEQLEKGPSKCRVGIQPAGRAPAREGTEIQLDGVTIGIITSGGFGPSVEAPVAMGYVAAEHASIGTEVELIIRGKSHPAKVCALPFISPNYRR